MPEALSSIGNFFGSSSDSGLLNLLGHGTTATGLVGNALNERTASQQINKLNALDNPTKLAQEVAATTAPLNTGLVQGVENQCKVRLLRKDWLRLRAFRRPCSRSLLRRTSNRIRTPRCNWCFSNSASR